MSLSKDEIQAFFRRVLRAVQNGYSIARGDFYAQELGSSDDSPASLLEASKRALQAHAEEVAPPEPVEVPTLVPSAAAPEPAPPAPEPVAVEPEPAYVPKVPGVAKWLAEEEPVELAELVGEEEEGEEEAVPETEKATGDAPAPPKPPRRRGKKKR